MNRKQRRAWYREKGMSYGEARKVAREQARLEAQVLRMSPEGARRVLAEWASRQHSQADVDALNGATNERP
jgi:hypothetical protein